MWFKIFYFIFGLIIGIILTLIVEMKILDRLFEPIKKSNDTDKLGGVD